MDTTTLATFRIDKKTWKKFKKWAAAKDSNASKELNEFILRALGLIDEDIDTNIDNNLEKRIEDYLETNIHTRIEETIDNYLDYYLDKRIYNLTRQYLEDNKENDLDTNLQKNIDVNIDSNLDKKEVEQVEVEQDNSIDEEEPLEESKKEQLTNAELARRMGVSSSTVSRWANQKRQPPENLEWRYDPKLKKWVK